MNLAELQSNANDAAKAHEHLTRRVRDEAGTPGISRLRVRLSEAARRRISTEIALNKAKEAMKD